MRPLAGLVLAWILLHLPSVSNAAAPREAPDERTSPAFERLLAYDNTGRLDANNVSLALTNYGHIAFDIPTGGPGLEFPKGSGKTAVFAGGLWIGAEGPRVAIAEYSSEFAPGAVVGGLPDDRYRLEYKVYRLKRVYGNWSERNAALADYVAGAVPFGAPPVSVLPDGSLSISGDQMTWSVYNDASPLTHTNRAGSTAPLGVEVQQTSFAFDRPGPLGNTVFLRFKILNKGSNTLNNTYVGMWLDPDVGSFVDDLVGSAPARDYGFAYNAYGLDGMYGSMAPAVGVLLLQGPTDPVTHAQLGAASFTSYVNGTDPDLAAKTYNALRGLNPNGTAMIDPTTGLPTRYAYSGDPVAATGWLDSAPTDKRMLLSSGPFTMAPGDVQEIVFALYLGQGPDHLASLARVGCDEPGIRTFMESGFAGPSPEFGPCQAVTHCPRPAAFWEQQCADGDLTAGQLEAIAVDAYARSRYLQLNDVSTALCQTLASSSVTDLRSEARREFAALLASASAGALGIRPAGGPRPFLDPGWALSCPGTSATTVGQLLETANAVIGGEYQDLVPNHPIPIEGVFWGGSGFGGGVGAMRTFFGTGYDPLTQADVFHDVELRFDASHPQKAYRFLRLEVEGTGGFPPVGRGYLFRGFRDVPFSCWDATTGTQLDMAFVERTLTDASGTIMPPSFQTATFDSTWSPDASSLGGREYLIAFQAPYTGSPDPAIAQDGSLQFNFGLPATYMLWARRISDTSVFDAGDRFRFSFDYQPGPGVDVNMILLEDRPLSDPAVQSAYSSLIQCMRAVNEASGPGICGQPPAVVKADAGPDRTVECAAVNGRTPVLLDGSASEGESLTFHWSAPGVAFDDSAAVQPTGAFLPGATVVTLEVRQGAQISQDQVTVTVVDTQPPTLTVTLEPSALWPPHHKLVAIHANVVPHDACDPSVSIQLVSLVSNEPESGLGSEDVPDDIQGENLGTADVDFQLRAERGESGNGRIYTACYEGRDVLGHVVAFQCGTVQVPRDRRGRAGLAVAGGAWRLTLFGSAQMVARNVAISSVVVGGENSTVSRPSGEAPQFVDVDQDGQEDVVLALSSGPGAAANGAWYARWTNGVSYMAEISPSSVTGVLSASAPLAFEVSAAPNPSRDGPVIVFALPRSGQVRLTIYDIAGHEVARPVDGWRPAGRHVASLTGRVPSQIYLYRLEWEGRRLDGKFAVIR